MSPPQQQPPQGRARLVGTWPVPGAEGLSTLRHSVLTAVLLRAAEDGLAARVRQLDLTLVISELVTNAVKYGAPPAEIRVYRLHEGWLVDVHDGRADEPPVPYPAEPGRSGRNGIRIVSRLSVRWGWYSAPPGRRASKHVWAQVGDRPAR